MMIGVWSWWGLQVTEETTREKREGGKGKREWERKRERE